MQEEWGEPGFRERPLVGVNPAVDTGREDLHGGLVPDPGVHALEPVIEPPQLLRLQVNIGARAEVHLADAAVAERVGPGPDQDLLTSPGRFCAAALLHPVEVDERGASIRVVPAAHVNTGTSMFGYWWWLLIARQ